MSTDRHRAEIREKRQKLAELKEARVRREKERRAASGSQTPADRPGPSTRAELDDIVRQLLRPENEASTSSSLTPATTDDGRRISFNSGRSSRLDDSGSDKGSLGTTMIHGAGTVDGYDGMIAPSIPEFKDAEQELFVLTPTPKLVYEKGIQTAFITSSYNNAAQTATGTGTSTDNLTLETDSLERAGGVGSENEAELRARLRTELEEERNRLEREIDEERARFEKELEDERIKGLDSDELAAVYADQEFTGFLENATKIVQRALSDGYDYLRDYTISSVGDGDQDNSERKRVKHMCTFWDDRWNKNRSITDVDWSHKFPELCAASYNKNPMSVNEPDGVACVWNLHLVDKPEFVFHAQSDVLSISFTPFHPNLIIGGTYSGQILLWDTRSRNPNPSLKTPLSATGGHTHPIYSLALVGTQNAHNLMSASTDGTVCAWVLDMLAQPQETLLLTAPNHNKTDEVSVTCLGFPEGETSTFFVGTEEGNIHMANRHDRAGAKAGLSQKEIYRGHQGPVMGMSFHPLAGSVDFSDLFLSCGVDWTVKLWRARGGGTTGPKARQPQQHASQQGSVSIPIASFEESDDYVFDVKWHPHHPALFGSVDGSGRFDLWNLNADAEVPVVSTVVNPPSPRGLNKLAWEKREGRRAAIGSSDGRLYVYEFGAEMTTAREGEWDLLRKTVSGLMGSDRTVLR